MFMDTKFTCILHCLSSLQDMDRTRQVYRACLDLIPHKKVASFFILHLNLEFGSCVMRFIGVKRTVLNQCVFLCSNS